MVDSETLAWLRSEIFIFGLAAIGGVCVLIGLWMEYVSTDEKRYETIDITGFGKLKSKERRGEIWVMVGIILEIAVAVGFAWRDDWHVRQLDAAMQWRTISKEQKNKFIFLCKDVPKIPIKILVGMEDNETENFAEQMRDMLDDAGFGGTNAGIIRDPTLI